MQDEDEEVAEKDRRQTRSRTRGARSSGRSSSSVSSDDEGSGQKTRLRKSARLQNSANAAISEEAESADD